MPHTSTPVTKHARRRVRVALALTLAGALLGAFALQARAEVQRGQAVATNTDATPILAVALADGGSSRELSAGRYRLTLRGVAPTAVWFSDEPARQAGSFPVVELISTMFTNADSPPNAALELADDVIIVELSDPRYREATDIVSFVAQVLEADSTEFLRATRLASFAGAGTQDLPAKFGRATLFIDDVSVELPPDDGDGVAPPPCPAVLFPTGSEQLSGQILDLEDIACSQAQAVAAATRSGALVCDGEAADVANLGDWECSVTSDGHVTHFWAAGGNTAVPNATFAWEATYECARSTYQGGDSPPVTNVTCSYV